MLSNVRHFYNEV